MDEKKLNQKDLARILQQTAPRIIPKGVPPVSLRQLVRSIGSYPIFKQMHTAQDRAIRAILVWEYRGKIISIYGDVDRFFAEHGLDNINDPRWLEIIANVSLTTHEFHQMFSESASIRSTHKPMQYIYLHTLWSDINAKYSVTEKVRQKFPAWIEEFATKLPKTFFNKLQSGQQFQKNRQMFMAAFEEHFPLSLKGERRWFNSKERQHIAEKAQFRCQWVYPDGQLCNKKLLLEKGEIDHMKPYSSGGRTILENARWICPSRNRGKGTKCTYDVIE
jgi:hypothetical protein